MLDTEGIRLWRGPGFRGSHTVAAKATVTTI